MRWRKNTIIKYKEQTNARSALVESGASSSEYRRASNVPYDFSAVFQNPELGPLFKELIINRFIRCGWTEEEIEQNMPQICRENKIAEIFNVEPNFFQIWLTSAKPGNYIQKLNISEFIAMKILWWISPILKKFISGWKRRRKNTPSHGTISRIP